MSRNLFFSLSKISDTSSQVRLRGLSTIFRRANNLFVSTALSTTNSTGLSGRKGGGGGVRNFAALLRSAKFCEIRVVHSINVMWQITIDWMPLDL